MRRLLPWAGLWAAALIADQAVKHWAESSLPFQEPVPIMPFLAFYRTWNTGISFSFLGGLGPLALSLLSVCVMAFVLTLAARTQAGDHIARAGFALILAGATGNLIDRLRFGHVVDYMLFYTETWSFAVFNLADACITVGAALILLHEVLGWRAARKSNAEGAKGD